MLRTTCWLAIVALVAAGGCKKTRKPPPDAAITIDAAAADQPLPPSAPPSVQSKLDDAARTRGDVHAPPVEGGAQKPPRDPTGIKKHR